MDFSKRQPDPRRHVVSITVVVGLHVLVVYALVTGLAKKVVDVVREPIETQLIEEVRKPAPPPEIVVPPPPRLELPPPPFIPPPEVRIATPPPQPTITVTAPPAPPAPVVVAPAPPPPPVVAAPAPPPPAAPAPAPAPAQPVTAGVACSNYSSVMGEVAYPREAIRQGIDRGDALIQFTLGANGEIRDIKALRASNPIFARSSERIVAQYQCRGQGREVTVTVPFGYRLE